MQTTMNTFSTRAAKLALIAGLGLAVSGCAQIRQHCEASDLNRFGCVAITAGIVGGTIAIIENQNDDHRAPPVVTYREDTTQTVVDDTFTRGTGLNSEIGAK